MCDENRTKITNGRMTHSTYLQMSSVGCVYQEPVNELV